MQKYWILNDIERLRKYYLEGQSIKSIARNLQRTPTAVNKCLSRFNIRPRKRRLFIPLPKKTVFIEKPKKPVDDNEFQQSVLQYAKNILNLNLIALDNGCFQHNHSTLTLPQVLLKVNADRVERRLPPFTMF